MSSRPRYPGIRVTANGNQLVSYHTETRVADAGIFYPITPSTEGGELYQQAFAEGKLNVFGGNTIAVEAEGEHAAQGGAIAHSVCGKRVVNYTSGQGVVYGVEQYYHAPGKCSTMVLEVAARALTKHALNVHCGHDDVYGALDTGWIIVFGKDAQQAADQALVLRRVTELSLTPGRSTHMGDGWETRRRRGPGHDWSLVKLATRGALHRIEIDTDHFKGNAPGRCMVEVCDAHSVPNTEPQALATRVGVWHQLLPETPLQPHARHRFTDLTHHSPATHVRLNIYPDGGIARMRAYGLPERT